MKSLLTTKRESTFAVVPAVLLLSVLASPAVLGGTVFMKNGYILQGPIVDQDEDMVVMGWDNGKVFIYRRFMDSVVLEGEEEALIARNRQQADEGASGIQPLLEGEVVVTEDDLPQSFTDVLSEYNIPTFDSGSISDFGGEVGTVPADGTSDGQPDEGPGDAGDEGPVEVRVVKPRRVEVEELQLSLEPPADWEVSKQGDSARWTGAFQEEDGFAPSIVVVRADLEGWNRESAIASLREAPLDLLPDFQVLTEGDVTVGGRAGYEVTGLGHPADTAPGAERVSLSLKHVLVPGDGHFWLISTFSSENTTRETLQEMQVAVESLRLLERIELPEGEMEPELPEFPDVEKDIQAAEGEVPIRDATSPDSSRESHEESESPGDGGSVDSAGDVEVDEAANSGVDLEVGGVGGAESAFDADDAGSAPSGDAASGDAAAGDAETNEFGLDLRELDDAAPSSSDDPEE